MFDLDVILPMLQELIEDSKSLHGLWTLQRMNGNLTALSSQIMTDESF